MTRAESHWLQSLVATVVVLALAMGVLAWMITTVDSRINAAAATRQAAAVARYQRSTSEAVRLMAHKIANGLTVGSALKRFVREDCRLASGCFAPWPETMHLSVLGPSGQRTVRWTSPDGASTLCFGGRGAAWYPINHLAKELWAGEITSVRANLSLDHTSR